MWLALAGTVGLIAIGGWQTLAYSERAAQAPAPTELVASAASPTPRAHAAAVVLSSSSSLTMVTSTPAASAHVDDPPARAPAGGWITQLAALPALVARGMVGTQAAPT